MNESRLAELFQAYFAKTATPDERDELMELLAQPENEGQVKALLAETWQRFNNRHQVFTEARGEEMLANILHKRTVNEPIPVIRAYRLPLKWLRIPAAAAILLFTIAGGYLWLKSRNSRQQAAQAKISTKDAGNVIVPGGNKAVLTLSDGSHLILDSISKGTLATQGDVKIVKLNTATLAYNAGDENSQEIVYNTLSTPKGGQYQLILPDGTRVWLNAFSSIHFPTQFKGNERKVTVTGEAYFEVAKNAGMPFTVSVKDMEVQVLGTHFNIMAYDDENSMNTTLLEGSVKVSQGGLHKMLVPGEESRIGKTGNIKVVTADIEETLAWKSGWFQFNSYDIKKIMRQISRWYNVEVIYEGKVPAGHFSGIVKRENDIKQVLKIMEAGGVRYKIEGRKVVILS